MVNNERKLGVILTYVNIFLNTLVMLVYTPFLLRYLGQSEYGLYALAMSILTYLALLDFGFGNAIVILTSKYIVNNENRKQEVLYSTVLSTYYFISFISIVLIIFFYQMVSDVFSSSMSTNEIEIFKKVIVILGINIAFAIPGNMFRSILTAYERFVFLNSISILRALSIPLLIVIVIYFEYRTVTMIAAVTLVNISFLLVQYVYYKKNINVQFKIADFDKNVFKLAFKYSIFVFIATIVDQVNWNFGQLIIGSYLGAKDIAVYSIAVLFNTTFIMLSSAVSSVLLPKVSKMIDIGVSNHQLTLEMIKIGRLQSYIVLLVLFGFALFGETFIYYWAGSEYEDAYFLTLIIMVPLSIPLMQNLGLSILKAKNKFYFRAVASLVMSFFTIILSLILTKEFGYWGVAISVAITFFILNGIIMNIYYWYIGIDVFKFWLEISRVFTPMLVIFIIMQLITDYIHSEQISSLIFEALFFITVIIAFSYFYIMNKYEKGIMYGMWSKIGSLLMLRKTHD